jgi:lipopolysaccharide/colanic/teichoic acid biosynthesis glycosyltransferase
MYAKAGKRVMDFGISLAAILLLSPVLLVLTALGAFFMKGNPFFTQERPGRHEKIFRLIKFRTMTNARGADGELLPDAERLNGYGRFLRATSLDELPELFNILLGQMALVGPRPLLIRYLPAYTAEERHRHDVRPGLTGLAQVNGRNFVGWDRRLAYDVEYVKNITFRGDLQIVLRTIRQVFAREDIAVDTDTAETYLDEERGVPHDQGDRG